MRPTSGKWRDWRNEENQETNIIVIRIHICMFLNYNLFLIISSFLSKDFNKSDIISSKKTLFYHNSYMTIVFIFSNIKITTSVQNMNKTLWGEL